ncbi:HvfC/BufC N-terminal domain-containing protein [Tropicimonas marinistellae]|uniref:HvfC/BufC N-terminal domain-containing protein n=1 Tax=Tropicimonas marinistellae TaxID=1739787 RepID=UPI00083258C2|nr:putative DNA-binding domain-containing protein [Tropicimonas marinistellae]
MNVDQHAFRSAILDPTAHVPDGLVDPKGRAAGKRFDVYRNNVIVSLSNALAEAFPAIQKLLGPNNFSILAGHFVRAHPPRSPLIALYGDAMPAFLETFEPVQKLGYLPDVARLELALRQSYHAADSQPVDPALLQQIPPDRLPAARLILAPAMRLVASDWPIAAIWKFNMANGPKPAMRPETALVTRPEFDPGVEALTPAGGAFVSALAARQTLGDALATASGRDPAFDLMPTLGALIAGGAITAIEEE